MGYIGNQTSNSYTSLDKQTITGNGGASYTLDHAVANEQEIEVFVNNVRQEPSVAYTVSGTALTMTGNVESSDDFYVVFQGKAIQTTSHPEGQDLKARDGTFSGDVTAVNSDFTGDLTITSSDPTITFVDGSGSASISGDGGHITYDSWTANRDHIFTGAGNERFRVLGDGGVTFNGDTAAANALDDYEEGTWTPTVEGASTAGVATYNSASTWGRYTKVGNSVHLWFSIEVTGYTTNPSGQFLVKGVPFTPPSTEGNAVGPFMSHDLNHNYDNITASLFIGGGQDYIRIFHTRDGLSWGAEQIGTESFTLFGDIQYRTN